MSATTLGSKLPADDKNGLPSIATSLLEHPHHLHAVIMLVDCGKIVEDIDEDTRIPMARIRRIEPVAAADYRLADQLLRKALADRRGSTELPLEDQRDLFSFLNPDVTMPPDIADPSAVRTRHVDDQPTPVGDTIAEIYDAEQTGSMPQHEQEPIETAPTPAREREDTRIATNQAKRAGRTKPKLDDPFSVV